MDALQLIMSERARQNRKWGVQNHPDLYWLAIIMEEIGETAQAIIDRKGNDEIDTELTQVAAVAVAWLECRARKQKIKNALEHYAPREEKVAQTVDKQEKTVDGRTARVPLRVFLESADRSSE